MEKRESQLLLQTCLLYGEVMATNSLDSKDVQEDIFKISNKMNAEKVIIYQTLTGIFVTFDQDSQIEMCVINATENNFEKITLARQALDDFEKDKLVLKEFYDQLKKIRDSNYSFSIAFQSFSAGVVSASMGVVFTASLTDFFINFIISSLSYFVLLHFQKKLEMKSFSIFLSSSVMGILIALFINLNLAVNPTMIILACIMPLVPGIEIVNSIRSILENSYLIAASQILEVLMITTMLLIPVTFWINILT